MIAVCLLTFVCGAAYECGCVFWVHYSERSRRIPAVGWSMFNCMVTMIGTEAFLTHWQVKIAFMAGFGTGTYFAIGLKGSEWFKRLTGSPSY